MLSDGLYEYLQKVQSYLAPPIAAIFLLGIFWDRINARGAFATLVGGFLLGFTKLFLELSQESLTVGSWIHSFATINWLVFGVYFFATCICLAIGFSLTAPKPSSAQLVGLTMGSVTPEQKAENRASYGIGDIIATVLVLGVIAFIMISFSNAI